MAGVLVVEHDAALRTGMAEALRKVGVTVHEAEEGQEAFDRLEAGLRPDLIVMALSLTPGMSGWEFRSALLRDPDLALIPVCVVIEAGEERETAEHLSAAAALHRPFKPDQLLEVIRRHIGPLPRPGVP
jgi:Response regulators consisting of a CheY-like receiver domain and a winged-helix DNA-binding domain